MSGPVQFSFANSLEGRPPGAISVDETVGIVEEEAPPVAKASSSSKAAAKRRPKEKPSQPINVVKLAKARLSEVKRELRRMQDLEKERAELERLIAAAKGPVT